MKIYLAARYSRRDELRVVREELTRLGHTVTSRWLDTGWELAERGDSTAAPPEYREQFAAIDAEDVYDADAMVNFTEPPGPNPGRGGRHVEFGMAYAWGKRMVVIGYRENLFHHVSGVEFYQDSQAMLRVIGQAVTKEEVFAHGG